MSQKCKYVILVGDGMADRPLKQLGGRTPLEAAKIPNMNWIARKGVCGMVRTVPKGVKPGSDVANLSIFGYDPKRIYRYDIRQIMSGAFRTHGLRLIT